VVIDNRIYAVKKKKIHIGKTTEHAPATTETIHEIGSPLVPLTSSVMHSWDASKTPAPYSNIQLPNLPAQSISGFGSNFNG